MIANVFIEAYQLLLTHNKKSYIQSDAEIVFNSN